MKSKNIEITEVRIRKVEGMDNLVAYANLTINNSIALKGIKIIEVNDERFIVMPGKRNTKTDRPKRYSNFHPISQDILDMFKTAIFEEYDNSLED